MPSIQAANSSNASNINSIGNDNKSTSISNTFQQLASKLTAVKNTLKTLIFGSSEIKQKNTIFSLNQIIYSVSNKIDGEYENIERSHFSKSASISSRFEKKHFNLKIETAFSKIKNEVLKLKDTELSHHNNTNRKSYVKDEKAELLLGGLYQLYTTAKINIEQNINIDNNQLIKNEIDLLIANNFTNNGHEVSSATECLIPLDVIYQQVKDKLEINNSEMKRLADELVDAKKGRDDALKELNLLPK